MRNLSEVYVIGAGETKFGELWDRSLRELAVEAGLKAIEDAGIYSRDIGILYGSNSLGAGISYQNDVGSLIADFAGIAVEHTPAVRVEASTASGGAAVREAYLAIKSGEYDVAVVGGVEKLTEVYGSEILDLTSTLLDSEWEAFFGATPAALAAMTARRYLDDFHVSREIMAMISVNDHSNASLNPDAQYRNKLTVQGVLDSVSVAEPLTMMDCSPLSDGAAAVVLASEEFMKKMKIEGVRIVSSEISQDYLALHSRKSVYEFESAKIASRKALEKAGIKNDDISFVELHDSFSIYGLIELEDLGFAEKGNAKSLVENNEIRLDGSIPVNPSGGLKAKGNPYGATGVGQFVEAYLQFKNRADKRQIKDVRYGMLHSMAGSGSTSVVHILGGE
ncbi:MAG: thiolase domain-containing protein [Candidatus Thermoplasmatota archaeon]|nr:thiolase domain-containing protein [Candidatus Thermoplasmatota archaeon]MCL5665334.1 thiolase domain-containing protein [Candidatus Thermoplasmatota archaeon]